MVPLGPVLGPKLSQQDAPTKNKTPIVSGLLVVWCCAWMATQKVLEPSTSAATSSYSNETAGGRDPVLPCG